jgi:hypothetical protein
MAKAEFILQGFTTRTHRAAVRELFDVPDLERIVLSVSYIKESGVQEIENQLKAHAAITTILAGFRNEITSHQGVARLQRIPRIKLYGCGYRFTSGCLSPEVLLGARENARPAAWSAAQT